MTHKRKLGLASFFMPVFLMAVAMVVLKVFPFGNHTFLIWDMDWQYSSFFVHLHDILHGEASAWYSLSRAIGGDMIGVSAYYLISPFNILFYFFDETNIYIGICIVMILKIGLIGWSMNDYLMTKHESVGNLMFSTAYALSGFVTAYFFNIIWLDGIMLLPLMVLGIERLIDNRRYMLYMITLGLAIATSFYIGYMLCIFSVLYFVCYFFLLSEQKKKISTIFIYAGSSILGGMLSAAVAIPALYSMQDGKSKIDFNILKNFARLFDVSNLFSKSFSGTIETLQITSGGPLLYCGVLSLFFVWTFFMMKHISWKRKLAYGVMTGFMLASLIFYNLCCAWQAFNMPNGSQYRFAFLYLFLMLVIAAESYWSYEQYGWEKGQKRNFLIVGVFLVIQMILVRDDFLSLHRQGVIIFNFVLIAAYALICILAKNKKILTAALMMGMSVELLANALFLYENSSLYKSTTVSDYKDYVERVSGLAEQVKEQAGLFRTVMTGEAYRTVNDNFMFNLYGLDSYTSVERDSTQLMAFNLGYYRNMVFGIHYKDGTTHAAESFLGVKYQISSVEPQNGYKEIAEDGTLGLYENKAALPLAFFVESDMGDVENEPYNCFAYENEIYRNISDEAGEPVFSQTDWKLINSENCTMESDGSLWIDDTEKESYVDYQLQIDKEGSYYVQYLGSQVSTVTLIVNGEQENLEEQANVVKRLGYLKDTDEVILRCYLKGEGAHSTEQVYVYFEDEGILQQYAAKVQQQEVAFQHKFDDNITIQCNNTKEENSYMLCTIPYDAGWNVTVDGKKAEVFTTLGNYMLFEITPGEHVIELKFIPQGLYIGIAVSVVTILLLLLIFGISQVRKQKNGEKAEN